MNFQKTWMKKEKRIIMVLIQKKKMIYPLLFILYSQKKFMQKFIMLGVRIVMKPQVLKVLNISEKNYYQEIIKT